METNIVVQDNTENMAEFSIIQSIYEIRGQRVMLDFDLAAKYEIETSQLKRAVRRNIERFEGEDFMFVLTKNEVDEFSRCQIGTLNKGRGQNIKYHPFAFTELGVAMLSSVLNSEKAIKVNRDIMRSFVLLRQYVLNFAEIKQELVNFIHKTNTKFENNDILFKHIFKVLDKLIKEKNKCEKPRNQIGFKQKNKI